MVTVPFLSKYRKPLVPVIRLHGMIASGSAPRLNDAVLAPLIEAAFRKGRPKAVALSINSPGGSPAQSSLIAARIRRLATEHKVPVHAFVEDMAASGGYWLATAADEIWLDDNSIVGSIGVISAGFGFQDLIARHGVERRVYTSGTRKGLLDPFRSEDPEDVARLKAWQAQIHAAFIAQVKARRAGRLSEDTDLFQGDAWIGQKAVDVGLADGIAHLVPRLKALYGDKVRMVPYGPRRPLLGRFGLSLVEDAMSVAEERALRSRFGA